MWPMPDIPPMPLIPPMLLAVDVADDIVMDIAPPVEVVDGMGIVVVTMLIEFIEFMMMR